MAATSVDYSPNPADDDGASTMLEKLIRYFADFADFDFECSVCGVCVCVAMALDDDADDDAVLY